MSRWDLGAIEELPSYMRIIYQSVLKTVEDIDLEMKARGKFGSLQPTIDEVYKQSISSSRRGVDYILI